ncbi:MAG: amino acid ABC transporter ATP-binding protein [Parvibaculaceae bacterium]
MTPVIAADVRKSFGPVEVLKGVSVTIAAGERVVLLGRSGSGKSTLLRCMNGLERIDGGRLEVLGIDLAAPSADLRALRRKVGIVFQGFNLFPHLTVEQNVTLAQRRVLNRTAAEAIDRAGEVLAQVGMADKRQAYPSELSGGQQQRVAIARSLALSPALMLFDEITSALDPELIGEVVNVLFRLAEQNMTMLLVTHQLGFARSIGSRIAFMHQGRIHEEGEARAVTASPRTPEFKTFLTAALT